MLGFTSASTSILAPHEEIVLPFSTMEAVLLDAEVADKMATTDSLGRKGIYLIPDRNMSWSGFKRPNPDTLSLYSFYPEEIWWYRVRHWLEITELREKNNELSLSLRSRQPGEPVKPDYLLRLRFRREADSLVLLSKKLYPID